MKDDKYYIDYGQIETREPGNTKTNWWVALPGYSHIKRSDVFNTQAHHSNSQSYDSKPVFMTEYKPIQYKEEYKTVNNVGNTPNQNKEATNKPVYRSDYKPSAVQYKEEPTKPIYKTEYKPIQYKEEYKPVNNVGNMPTQNKEEQNKPVYRSEYKPSVQYKEESTKPIYKTEYKPIQYNEEYKPVSNAGYTPNQNEEAYKPISETEEKPPVMYKEESINPVYKTEYKPNTQNKEEYKPVEDAAGYTNEEDGF